VVEAGKIDQLKLFAGASFGDQVAGEALPGEQQKFRLVANCLGWQKGTNVP